MPDLDQFSYVPSITPDDEEQRRKNALLGLPLSPAKPPMLGDLPPEPVKLTGADDNGPYREPDSGLVRRGAGAKFDPQAEYERQVQMGPPTPVAAEHRPFWKTALGALGEGMLGGPAAARDWFDKPQAEADAANKAQLGNYTARIGQLGGLAAEQSETALKQAQAENQRALADKALREAPDKAPATVDTGTGQRMQYNPKTNTYDIPIGAAKPETSAMQKPDVIEMGNRTYQWDVDAKKWNDIGPAKQTASSADAGTWSIQEDNEGKPILLNSKSGATRPANGIQKSGTKLKQDAATTKANEPFQSVLDKQKEAQEFAAQKTGPGDIGLILAMVEATRPKAGFRMTQTEWNNITHARSTMGDLQALQNRVMGGQMLTDQQRQQMLAIIDIAAQAAQKRLDKNSSGNSGGGGGGGWRQDPDGVYRKH